MLYLGLDGGGTGCRAALADAQGRVLGEGAAGPANIASDPDGAREHVLAAIREAAAAAGVDVAALAGVPAVMGLAGANVGAYADRLAAALPFRDLRIESDALIAVKGALEEADGIVAALGTGSVFAAQRGGAVRQIGGWGFLLGDEGSGAWIGRRLLSRVLRAADGFVAPSPLTEAVAGELGGPEGVVRFALGASPAGYAAFAPRLTAAAGDPAAAVILAEADAEIAAAINLLQAGEGLPVVFLGGLGPVFARRLAGRWPILPARGNALRGALWMARRRR